MKKIALLFILFIYQSCSHFVFYALPEEKFSRIEREYFTISNEIFSNSSSLDLLSIAFSIKDNKNKKVSSIYLEPLLMDENADLKLEKVDDNINGLSNSFKTVDEFNINNKGKENGIIFFSYRSSSNIQKSKSLKLKYRIEFDDGKVFEEELDMVLKKVRNPRG